MNNHYDYTFDKFLSQTRLIHRIEIRIGGQDDVVDIWRDENGTIAIDFVSGNTTRELKDISRWADFGLP